MTRSEKGGLASPVLAPHHGGHPPTWVVGLVGVQSERFRKVTLTVGDLEERMLRDVDAGRFRGICQNALEGLASKTLNLEMLIERRARAQERRVVPETIARFLREAAEFVPPRGEDGAERAARL